jgi:hypothetical protein
MSYAGWALGAGRAAAVELMLDTITVTRPTGEPGELDPETGEREPAPTTTVYSGPGKVQTFEGYEAARKSGEHVYIEQRYQLHLPIMAGPVRVGDTATVTAAVHDPNLTGRTYRVAGLLHKSMATAQRLLIDEITG